MIRILVTGTGGFLGGAIWRRLSARDDVEAIATARTDLGSEAAVAAALSAAAPDVVVHAAGRTRGSEEELYADNVLVTQRLAAVIGAASPETGLILLSSAAQYGRSADRAPWRESGPCEPLDAYGLSKLAAEATAFAEGAESGGKVTSLRIFNVIAPEPQGEQVFFSFLRKAAVAISGSPPRRVEMGPLTAIRDFVDIRDVVTAVERVIDRDVWGAAVNVCTGVGRPVRPLLDEAAAQIGHGLEIGEADGPPPLLDWSVGDPELCKAKLGFTPDSDLSSIIHGAASWVAAAARQGAHA